MTTARMIVLFEHATGYALFTVKEFEEIGQLLPEVQAAVKSVGTFKSILRLLSFYPFKSGTNALDNCNSISEGIIHDDLKVFLQANIRSDGRNKFVLGVSDSKLGASINEELGLSCQHSGAVQEIMRGLRQHFPKFIEGLSAESASKAQLGLGHSYSRCKVKFNVNRTDNMIIQSINLLDQLDKDVNTFSMRCREWYSYHFPELYKIVSDNYNYARVCSVIGDRKQCIDDKLEAIEEILGDSDKAQAVVSAAKSSMGMDISALDLINIEKFANKVVSMADYRKELAEYLHTKMENVAPNLSCLIGDAVGARLISHAGSLTNLAKYPASTIQILGAEKALFRALKTRSNTPKYGLIYHSNFISRSMAKNKGRVSRFLANKCSIASRIDCFAEFPTTVFGNAMRQQVEDRLAFYESGAIPQKNADVMASATEEASVVQAKEAKKEKKKKKKAMNGSAENAQVATPTVEKKKKKKRKAEDAENDPAPDVVQEKAKTPEVEPPKKKKKKSKA